MTTQPFRVRRDPVGPTPALAPTVYVGPTPTRRGPAGAPPRVRSPGCEAVIAELLGRVRAAADRHG